MTPSKNDETLAVSCQKVTTTYHETGVGQADREEVTYVVGITVDGVFVPVASIPQNRVDLLVAAGKAAAEASATDEPAA